MYVHSDFFALKWGFLCKMLYLCMHNRNAMRVLIVNTSERTGGAAVAANRLKDALNNNGVKAKMLVRDKTTDDITVVGIGGGWRSHLFFLWERWCVFWHLRFNKKHLFEIDIANIGHDITRLPEFKEADVIHLHWINQGMLSLRGIRKILESGKPVVWTMHDIWPATAICHYARGCKAFYNTCQNCQLVSHAGMAGDLAKMIWKRKYSMLNSGHVSFVTCSKWLALQAKHSALLAGHSITNIPNTIDTAQFYPKNKIEARQQLKLPQDKKIILFVSQKVTDERKGMDYFVDAVERLVHMYPEMCKNTEVAILGGHAEDISDKLPLPVHALGYVNNSSSIACVYNAADVFVLPSLEDNLPNTIMEAMACGIPCVGFRVGGIPEMIVHQKTGYVAEYKNADDLAKGIRWALDAAPEQICSNATRKVAQEYSQSVVAKEYIEVYNEAMALKNYKL